jgi:hypothetical protein
MHVILQRLKDQFEIWGATWLNLAGRVVLINVVSSSFLIFQFSSLHAPVGIKKEMAKLIKKFLWQGDKDNEKNIHMVNWSTFCAPKENGGLGIWDPQKINIALGEKLIWCLITGGKEWWKKEICYKYLSKIRKRCLETFTLSQSGSPIWNLFQFSMSLI